MKHPVKQAFSLSPGLSHRNVLGLSRSLGIELQQQIILAVWWILLIDQACSLKMACYWPRSTKTKQQNAVTNVARARSITSRLVNNAYPERTLARIYYPLAGAHQMEPPSPLISWVNPFPSRFINRTVCFPRHISVSLVCHREKNEVGWSRTQKPVLRPFSFFTIHPFLKFYSRWDLGIMK